MAALFQRRRALLQLFRGSSASNLLSLLQNFTAACAQRRRAPLREEILDHIQNTICRNRGKLNRQRVDEV